MVRIQVGRRQTDASDNLHPQGAYTPRSPYYDDSGANGLRDVFPQLFDADATQRDLAAANIRDLVGDLGEHLPAVAGMLVIAALVETDPDAYEQMLFALGDLSVRDAIPLPVLAPLEAIQPTTEWEVEYLEDILSNARYHAGSAER